MIFRSAYRIGLLSALILLPAGVPPAAVPTASGQAVPLPSALTQAIDKQVGLAQQVSRQVGVHVVNVATGATVYEFRSDELHIVASNAKLVTTAAALDALGPGFLFETRLVARGPVRAGVLEGDLGVVGAGDPNISGRAFDGDSFAIFRDWAKALRERGIRRVRGDLYLDHGFFQGPQVHPDWPRDQLDSWYEAPIDALSFSDNCVLVRVIPGRLGDTPRVELVPPVPILRIDNAARTTAPRKKQKLFVSRDADRLVVRGSISAGAGPFEVWVTVDDPVRYFGLALREALEQEGIRLDGRLLPVQQLPGPIWERVTEFRSDLVSTIRVTNKRSQNFYAESLLKHLGARRCRDGSWPGGAQAIAEFLHGIGIPRGSFHLVDGSGLSRADRFTPRQVTQLLRYMYFHTAGAEYAQSLPYGGEDNGGWNQRLALPPYRGNVFAKTGTLSDVSALAGYAKGVSGTPYAFSIVANSARSTGSAKRAEDQIVMALIDNG